MRIASTLTERKVMKRIIIFAALVIFLLGFSFSASATLFGIGGGNLYSIDTSDGSYTQSSLPHSLPFKGLTTYDGNIFYSSYRDWIYVYDRNQLIDYWQLSNVLEDINGLTFVGSSLWGMGGGTNTFYEIDTTTGYVTRSIAVPYNISQGFAGTDSTLIATGVFGAIYEFDLSGNLIQSNTLPENFNRGATWDGNDLWFSSTTYSSDNLLYQYNIFTGSTGTVYNNMPVMKGLASSHAPVPEPSTMLLLGTGLIGLAGWGRRKLKKIVS